MGRASWKGRAVDSPSMTSMASLLHMPDDPLTGRNPSTCHSRRDSRKSIVLFNLHRAVGCGDSVIVVEGFFDAVNVHQAGLPCVVALMGCSLSRRQEELLLEHFREGCSAPRRRQRRLRHAGAAIAQRLVSKLSTRLVELPGGIQPDTCSVPTRFDASVFRAISERWQPRVR